MVDLFTILLGSMEPYCVYYINAMPGQVAESYNFSLMVGVSTHYHAKKVKLRYQLHTVIKDDQSPLKIGVVHVLSVMCPYELVTVCVCVQAEHMQF